MSEDQVRVQQSTTATRGVAADVELSTEPSRVYMTRVSPQTYLNQVVVQATAADGGDFTCLQLCYVQGTTPPFDAGLVNMGAPGMGGCPANQNCGSVPNLSPAWLGLCQ